MERRKFRKEQDVYSLLCLDEGCCGTDILESVHDQRPGDRGLRNALYLLEPEARYPGDKGGGMEKPLLTDAGRERLGREYEKDLRSGPGLPGGIQGTEGGTGGSWTQAGRAP